MLITVVPSERVIAIDGVPLRLTFQLPDPLVIALPGTGEKTEEIAAASVEAINWNTEHCVGAVQVRGTSHPFKDPAIVEPYLTLWHDSMTAKISGYAQAMAAVKLVHSDYIAAEKEMAATRAAEDAARNAAAQALAAPVVEAPAEQMQG